MFAEDKRAAGELWQLDKVLEIQSKELEAHIAKWLRDFDSRAGQYEATLHTIIETLEKYAGNTEDRRRKGPFNAHAGKRPQLPTVRMLPTRRDALEHARKQGLLPWRSTRVPCPRTARLREGHAGARS